MAVIGYKYFLGLHMGVSRGPVDSLVEIRVGDKKAWPLPQTVQTGGGLVQVVTEHPAVPYGPDGEGNDPYTTIEDVYTDPTYTTIDAPAPVTTSSTITINQPNLFGGDTKEGGIAGSLDVMMGEPTQAVNPRLSAMLGGVLVSAFRGMFTMFYDGEISSMNPYPKPWKFRVRRGLKGWDNNDPFYPATCIVNLTVNQPLVKGGPIVANHIAAMNPAHIIWECTTNKMWGRGLDPNLLDEAAFTAAADTLYGEGFGLCLQWTRQDTVDAFVQQVVDHIGAVLYVSKTTGLLTLSLIRSDYELADLPLFTTSTGVITVEDDDSSTSQTLINEIIVTMKDPISGTDRQTRVQNIAGQQATGAVLSKSVDYPGLPTIALANRVAQRDLRVCGTALRRFKLTMDRRAYKLHPGSVFRFTDALRGITNMVLRVGRTEDTPEGRIVITAVADVFGLAANSFVQAMTSDGNFSHDPSDPTGTVAEMSYMDIRRIGTPAELAALTGAEAFIHLLGVKPSEFATKYQMYTGSDDLGYTDRGPGAWTPAGTLTASMTPSTTTVAVANLTLPATMTLGTPAMIGDEVVRIDGYDYSTNVTVLTISRGCADTIPEAHAKNAVVWFFTLGEGADRTVFSEGETVGGRLLTTTNNGTLSPADATLHSLTLAGRIPRPYPPANVRLGSTPFWDAPAPGSANFTLNWVSRNRITQGSVLVPHNNPTVTPETGQTDTIIVRDGGTAVRTVTGITTNTWSYDTTMWAADGSPNPLQIELFSERDGDDSWKHYVLDMAFSRFEATLRGNATMSAVFVAGPAAFAASLSCQSTVTAALDGASSGPTKYVRAGASGSASGDDWTNAYTSLPSTLTRGTTYYIADGTYAGYTFDDAASGTTVTEIRKATAADHGTSTGWSGTYGDGQAEFTGQLAFTTGYWLVNGVTGGGAINGWAGSFGFKVTETDDGTAILAIGRSGSAPHVTVQHIDLVGKGSLSSSGGSASNDGVDIHNGDSFTLSYWRMTGIGRCPFFVSPSNMVVEHGYVVSYFGAGEVSGDGAHSEIASIWNFGGSIGDVTFRYNLFAHVVSTGGIMWDNSSNTSATCRIYGNTFYKPSGATWESSGNGCIGGWTGGVGAEECHNLKVYNNSFVNLGSQRVFTDFLSIFSGNDAKNNMFYNCSYVDYSCFNTHDYNHYINSGGTHSETNGTSATSGSPFVDYVALDFQLSSATTTGTTLSAPYTTDPLGNTRGTGTWDRGAFEKT